MSEDDEQQALNAAVTCCILASAGPQRSRVLANLYKDERCGRLPLFPFLEKVFLDRILTPAEVRTPLPATRCTQLEHAASCAQDRLPLCSCLDKPFQGRIMAPAEACNPLPATSSAWRCHHRA